MPALANRVAGMGTTIFTTMNAIAAEHNALNLGQGAPNFDTPPEVVKAASDALLSGDYSQYANGWGAPALREAIAAHAKRFYDMDVNPDGGVVVTCGATEGLFDALYGSIDPGDKVIVIEPFYDIYVPIIETAGGVPVYVPLQPPSWALDEAALRAAFNANTRAIIINTPNNPTGHMFSEAELALIAELCVEYDVICISDEVYEHIVYAGHAHAPIGTLPGMFERNLRVSSVAKSFSAPATRPASNPGGGRINWPRLPSSTPGRLAWPTR